MKKHTLGYLICFILGLVLGTCLPRFFNQTEAVPSTSSVSSNVSSKKPAPPLSPDASPRLPAGHPPLEGETTDPKNPEDSTKAQAALEVAIKHAQSNLGDYILQMKAAALCYQNGKFEETLQFLKQAQTLRPDSFDAVSALGITYSEMGRAPEAEPWLLKALKLNPSDTDTRAELVITYVNLKKYDQAIVEAQKALQAAPSQERALEGLIKAYLAKENTKEAEKALERLSSINPGNPNLAPYRQILEKSKNKGIVVAH